MSGGKARSGLDPPNYAWHELASTARELEHFVLGEQCFDPHRQLANASSRRMIDGIGDCSRRPDIDKLTNPLDAERIDAVVRFRHHDGLNRFDVGSDL
jgi:hypothetical protein